MLAEEIGWYRLQICTVVWFDILHQVNTVSKLLQSPKMQLDVAVDLLMKAKALLLHRALQKSVKRRVWRVFCGRKYSGLSKGILPMKHWISPCLMHWRGLKTSFSMWLWIVPSNLFITGLRHWGMSKTNLVCSWTLEKWTLRHCQINVTNCKILTWGDESDIDGKELAYEIGTLPTLPSDNMTAMELLSSIQEKQLEDLHTNFWTALCITCILSVTVASAKRSFSKLKLLKTYLRSTMGQEHLSGLAKISVNRDISQRLSYGDIINDFVSKKI